MTAKRILLFFSLSTFISFAQVDSNLAMETVNDSIHKINTELTKQRLDHFSFKGIPIDGPLDQFVPQLKEQNFTAFDSTKVEAFLTGNFAGDEVILYALDIPMMLTPHSGDVDPSIDFGLKNEILPK
jgi:hypothetical protein